MSADYDSPWKERWTRISSRLFCCFFRAEEEKRMPYITSIKARPSPGFTLGIKSLLKVRFGDDGVKLMSQIENIHEEQRLEEILTTLETAAGLDEVRRLCFPTPA